MSNELATRHNSVMTTEELNEWGVPVISSQDVVIPKILLMQGLSVAVAEGRATMGEFRDSIGNALIGKMDAPFECIPFFVDKAWDIQEEQADGKFKWMRTVPVVENPASPEYNDNWKWEAEVNGIKVKNIRRFNFFVLLPSEIPTGSSMPYIISFKSTGLKEGMNLFTQMYVRNRKAGIPPAAYTISMGGTRQKNDKGIFIVPQYTLGRQTTDAERTECKSWIAMIKSGRVKIDESDVQQSMDLTTPSDDIGDF